MDIKAIRKEFPELSETVYGKQLVYLDNAATSQRPRAVVDKWVEMSLKFNSNLHRAVHKIAIEATSEFENTRKYVSDYIGAASPNEIVFTSGATASLNLLANSLSEILLHAGSEVIVSEAEHHSNLVPWQIACKRKRAVMKKLTVDKSGRLEIERLQDMINDNTALVCVSHISNVLGLINPIKEIVDICHSRSCPVVIDGSQGIVHSKVDVSEIGCDFYIFSGHKIYAAPGTGVLYARQPWLDDMPPYMYGGEMIETVKWNNTDFTAAPHKFEAGTQNISGVPTLVPALEMDKLMKSDDVSRELNRIRDYVYDRLISDSRIQLYGKTEEISSKAPLFSFCVKGAHHEDLALILDKMGIAVRSGQMCAEPLMDRFGVTGMLRASFAAYNTMEEAEYFVTSLNKAIDMLI